MHACSIVSRMGSGHAKTHYSGRTESLEKFGDKQLDRQTSVDNIHIGPRRFDRNFAPNMEVGRLAKTQTTIITSYP